MTKDTAGTNRTKTRMPGRPMSCSRLMLIIIVEATETVSPAKNSRLNRRNRSSSSWWRAREATV
ncbi:hypothetical protein D3C72_2593380 [compost metagenome]